MKKIIIVALVIIVGGIIWRTINTSPSTHNIIAAKYENVIHEAKPQAPAIAEIFIDASGSMKPYFKDEQMINAVSKIAGLMQDETKIYFIGNPIPYSGLVSNILGSVAEQPSNSTSTFHDFFKQKALLADTTNCIIYLVTDGIMSIKGDTKKSLVGLESLIKASLKNHNNIAAAVIRYSGQYDGMYYNQKNAPLKINMQRPFYIIALGQRPYIEWLKKQKQSDLYNPEGTLFMGLHDLDGHSKPTQHSIMGNSKINPLENITLSLDLPECLQDINEDAIQHSKIVNNGTEIKLPVTRKGNYLEIIIPPLTPGFNTNTKGEYETILTILNQLPSVWNDWSTESDLTGPDESTTFGLIYLINGMYNALEKGDYLIEAKFSYSN